MEKAFLIIETGYEGIEKLLFLTDDAVKATEMALRFKEKQVADRLSHIKEMNKYWDEQKQFSFKQTEQLSLEEQQNLKDFICVQKWDGEKFMCACGELNVNPSTLMLR